MFTKQDLKALKKAARKSRKNTPAQAKRILQRIGIIGADGKLIPELREEPVRKKRR